VHVNKFQTFSFDEFCLWDKARLDVRNIVESATESGKKVIFSFRFIAERDRV